jgi:magnesium transporter
VAALERLDALTEGETRLGALDAAGFVADVADEVLTGYLEVVEDIEREIDRLDERALRADRGDDILGEIVALRRRIGRLRRTLAPQRVVFAGLARPAMALDEDFGQPWPRLTDRLDRTIDAVESLRELLLGTFDIHVARAAKDANDVMKLLTLVSAVFLPSVVLAGVMGMNFQLPFFEDPGHFWVVVATMLGMALAIIAVAGRRRWI